jgi:predicted NUDIX family phosphoesterase
MEDLRKKLMDKYGDEEVFVVANEHTAMIPSGFNFATGRIIEFLEADGTFMPRHKAEFNPDFRQPIPYVVVKCGDKYFMMERLKNSGEARLLNMMTIGVGGHINPCDGEDLQYSVVSNALYREVHEELNILDCNIESIKFLGVINDDGDDVSKDHIGLVYLINATIEDVSVKETDKLEGKFYTMEEIESLRDRFENWTRFVVDFLKMVR